MCAWSTEPSFNCGSGAADNVRREQGGITVDKLLKIIARKETIFALRSLGEVMLPIGIITAALDKSFGGWTPIYWFLLSFAFFLLVICSELLRVILQLESKMK